MHSILIVEDELLVAQTLREMLEELGYGAISQASTITGVLAAIETNAPDIVVLASLRGVPARRVAERLKAKSIPFVVATGHDPRTLPIAFAAGVPLRKPYRLDELALAVQSAIALRQS